MFLIFRLQFIFEHHHLNMKLKNLKIQVGLTLG